MLEANIMEGMKMKREKVRKTEGKRKRVSSWFDLYPTFLSATHFYIYSQKNSSKLKKKKMHLKKYLHLNQTAFLIRKLKSFNNMILAAAKSNLLIYIYTHMQTYISYTHTALEIHLTRRHFWVWLRNLAPRFATLASWKMQIVRPSGPQWKIIKKVGRNKAKHNKISKAPRILNEAIKKLIKKFNNLANCQWSGSCPNNQRPVDECRSPAP